MHFPTDFFKITKSSYQISYVFRGEKKKKGFKNLFFIVIELLSYWCNKVQIIYKLNNTNKTQVLVHSIRWLSDGSAISKG